MMRFLRRQPKADAIRGRARVGLFGTASVEAVHVAWEGG